MTWFKVNHPTATRLFEIDLDQLKVFEGCEKMHLTIPDVIRDLTSGKLVFCNQNLKPADSVTTKRLILGMKRRLRRYWKTKQKQRLKHNHAAKLVGW